MIRNLTYQDWDVATPPPSTAYGNDENVATETLYHPDNGLAIATIEYWVEDSSVISRTTRTYYDDLGRVTAVVRNITETTPDLYDDDWPSYSTLTPDQNVRSEFVYDAAGNQIASIEVLDEGDEAVTRTYYDGLGRPVTVVRNLTGQTIATTTPPTRNLNGPADQNVRTDTSYDSAGNISSQTDPLENETDYEYDDLGRQTEVSDPLENSITFAYDNAGFLYTRTDAEGVVTLYLYDDLGRLTSVTENYRSGFTPDEETNVKTEYGYDKNGNLVEIEDARSVLSGSGDVTTFTYDDLDRLESESDSLENTWTYQYDKLGNRTQVEDPEEQTISYSYDLLGRQTGIDYPGTGDDVTLSYNALSWRTQMVDGVGTTGWTYDNLGRPTVINDPFNDDIEYAYDGRGLRTSLENPDGDAAAYQYDDLGRLAAVTDWDSEVISYTYDLAGQLTNTRLPNGVTSSYAYNASGWLESLSHSQGSTLSSFEYEYDSVGNRSAVTETLQMPDPGRIFDDGFESGDFSAWDAYSVNPDQVVTTTAALTGSYGMAGLVDDTQLLHVRDDSPDSETRYRARFYFDPNSISMPSGKVTQILNLRKPDNTTIVKMHFRAGSPYKVDAYVRKDNNGWVYVGWTTITDDVHAIEVDWRASSASGANDGGLTWWVDGTQKGSTSSVDNDTHRIDRVLVRFGGNAAISGASGTVCYDAFESHRSDYIGTLSGVQGCSSGRSGGESQKSEGLTLLIPVEAEAMGPDGKPVVLSDTVSITVSQEITLTKAITLNVPITGTYETPGGKTTVLTATVTITPTDYLTPTETLTTTLSYTETSDLGEAGILAKWVQPRLKAMPKRVLHGKLLMAASPEVTVIEYGYDPLYRLTDADYDDGSFTGYSYDYDYDAVGNRLHKYYFPGGMAAIQTTTYTYDAAHRINTVTDASGTDTYDWDDNGNLEYDGVYTYTYDAANRLIDVSGSGLSASYEYNGLGDRVSQTVDSVTTDYTLDIASGLTQVLGDGTNTYLYGLGRISQHASSSTVYFLADALGSVRQLTDESGAVSLTKSYSPFGEVYNSEGNGASNYGFTGEWVDTYIKLIYLRSRYYAPETGRFITRDTWQGDYTKPLSLNRWNYVEGNPINLTDPSGHCPLLGIDCIVIGGTILVIGGAILAFHILQNTDDFIRAVEDLRFGCQVEVKPRVTREQLEEAFHFKHQDPYIGPDMYPFPFTNPAPKPQPAPEPDPTSNPPKVTETPEPKHILYHYSSDAGIAGIIATQTIYPSLSDDNRAAFGHGQYFTDISPADAAAGSAYQLSRAIFITPWKNTDVTSYVAIDVSGLLVDQVAPVFSKTYGDRYIYLHRSQMPLSIQGRMVSTGMVTFSE